MVKTKNAKIGKFSRRTVRLIILGSVTLLLLIAATAQIAFDRMSWQNDNRHSNFEFAFMIEKAIDNLTEIKVPLNAANRMPEYKLQFPESNKDVFNLVYLYQAPIDGSIAEAQITTRKITIQGKAKLMSDLSSVERVLEYVSEAQACSRGFEIQVEEKAVDGADKTKTLVDGRIMSVWRENGCGEKSPWLIDSMNELEAYLLQAESY